MKKILKVIGVLLAVVILLVICMATFISIRGIPKYEVHVPNIPNVEVTTSRVAQGERIASMLCRDCHYNPETQKFTGRTLTEVPDFGIINSRNITNDKEVGIGGYTDAQLIYFIRTGIHPLTGQYSPPYMPKLMHISDEDLNSIIAFLRSDKPEVQANKTELPPSEPSFLTKFLCAVAFKPYPFPEKPIPLPDTTNKLELGKYIALYQLECYSCHSADFKKMDVAVPENSFGFFGGGNVMLNKEGAQIITMNITPDNETGIGSWTEEEFLNAVKYCKPPKGPALRYPMMPYTQLTDYEVSAIYAYLKTVPPLKNKIDRGI